MNWEMVFRLEDICGPRKKPEVTIETIELMKWLGLSWSGEVKVQSECLKRHLAYFEQLVDLDAAYHCDLSRKEIIEAQSAPAIGEHPSANIRPSDVKKHNAGATISAHNWRFVTINEPVTFHDEIRGQCTCEETPDFAIWTNDNTPSYQIAVVIDDVLDGVTDVVRGSDLIPSTAWQIQILQQLQLPLPRWWHLPLICGPDGRKLGKRHGDTTVRSYKELGVPVQAIYGLVAYWYDFVSERTLLTLDELQSVFNVETIPHGEIMCSSDDLTWLNDCSQ